MAVAAHAWKTSSLGVGDGEAVGDGSVGLGAVVGDAVGLGVASAADGLAEAPLEQEARTNASAAIGSADRRIWEVTRAW